MASFAHPKTRIIDPERLLIEGGAVHQEFHLRGKDVMETLLDDLLHRTMYTTNPVRHRVDCEVKDLKNITQKDIERFLRRYYVPKNAFAIILGPKVEDAKALAEHYFRDWEGKSVPIFDYDHSDDLPELSSVRSFELERAEIGQYHFAIGFPTEGYASADGATLDVIKNILEYRLNWLLREENRDVDKGVYRTPVYTERSLVHGLIEATFATTSREFEARAEEVVLGEFRKLATELVQRDELETMTEVSRNGYLDAFWNIPASLCELIADAATNDDGNLDGLHAYREEILRVNRRKIREVAAKYFGAGKNYARVLIKPAA
jgi:predicted Zn-dependent peptidase